MPKIKKVEGIRKVAKVQGAHGKAKRPVQSTAGLDPAEDRLTIERRAASDRRHADRREENIPIVQERRNIERRAKVCRRREIDPTTCERDYTAEELEFMSALDAYKRTSGRMFPTCSEMLEVFKKLGYEKRPAASPEFPLASESALPPVTQPCEVPSPAC
ncbi:MAG: hypothetical protein ACLQNE_34780 [Thermoguttaceae bacterium]